MNLMDNFFGTSFEKILCVLEKNINVACFLMSNSLGDKMCVFA